MREIEIAAVESEWLFAFIFTKILFHLASLYMQSRTWLLVACPKKPTKTPQTQTIDSYVQ